MILLFRHFGSEIVDLPMAGYCYVQRIELSIDHHYAILTNLSVGAPGVEKLDDRQFPPRKLRHCAGQGVGAFHAEKEAPRVKTGRPHQQRETEAVARHRGGGLRRIKK